MVHTNKAVAMAKYKRSTMSEKSRKAIESGNVQAVIDSLTGLQRKFCEEYLIDLKATPAAIRAGYAEKYANRQAYQLMENEAIRICIDALKAERSKNSDVTKDYVLQGIQRIIRKAEEDGNHNATLRGLELLARHLGMFIERTEISGPDGEAIKMEQKVNQDVADFKSRLSRLAKSTGTGGVAQLPDPDGDAEA